MHERHKITLEDNAKQTRQLGVTVYIQCPGEQKMSSDLDAC